MSTSRAFSYPAPFGNWGAQGHVNDAGGRWGDEVLNEMCM